MPPTARPCRYFQTNSCQRTADECDFAHVIITDATKEPRHARLCRFFLAGYCKNGDDCRFTHEAESPHSEDGMQLISLPASKEPPDGTPITVGESPRSFSSDESTASKLSHLPPLYIPPTPGSSPPGYWPVYEYTVPPYYYSDETPYYYSTMIQPTITRATEPVAQDPNDSTNTPRSRAKAKMHKSTPLLSALIHEDSERRTPGSASPTFREQAQTGLPSKPLSPLEESHKRGFYPITWRVIGGGVRMGVNRFPRPSESRSKEPSPARQESPIPQPRSKKADSEPWQVSPNEETPEGNLSAQRPQSRSVAPPGVLTLNVNVSNASSSTPSPRTRARANSIPSTPCAAQVKPTVLFAAAELP
ncbi:hypothetical protein V5O48_002113 [Marasmius crinis-equi]|uniref:C3H1-type domain-containing protein n=1 Tax=Marasmius crinis-equi TaxID=585013 RepID=A0ABR3FWI9_9AGAR